MDSLKRPRRNRKSAAIRAMVAETRLSVTDLMFPLFLLEGQSKKTAVEAMPDIYRLTTDHMLREIEACMALGIRAFVIFPVVEEKHKDQLASKSHDERFFYHQALRKIKQTFPEACVMTDVAMDPYSTDGHDGVVDEKGHILNDESLEILGEMALSQAQTGIDIVGPSDMMDGRIQYIRELLDEHGFEQTSIMAYTAKYASAFYGPFRAALDSAPQFGDKKTYQMNPANRREAMIEAELDEEEGADFLMVKPALAYLDVIRLLADHFDLPIAAYQVSGEYAMLKAAAQKGWLDHDATMMEALLSIKRAGAQVVLTYFAKAAAQLMKTTSTDA